MQSFSRDLTVTYLAKGQTAVAAYKNEMIIRHSPEGESGATVYQGQVPENMNAPS